MEPKNDEFDEVEAMFFSLFGEEEEDDDTSSSLTTLSGPSLPQSDADDACSSSVTVKNDKGKDDGKNGDVGSSSSLLGKRRDVREREAVSGSYKKVKENNGVFENFADFYDLPEIDETYFVLDEKERSLNKEFDHDLGSGDSLELYPTLEELLEAMLDPVVDRKEDCGEFGIASVEDLSPEINGWAQLDDGKMDPAIDNEHVACLMDNQNLMADGEGEEIDTLEKKGTDAPSSSYQCG